MVLYYLVLYPKV